MADLVTKLNTQIASLDSRIAAVDARIAADGDADGSLAANKAFIEAFKAGVVEHLADIAAHESPLDISDMTNALAQPSSHQQCVKEALCCCKTAAERAAKKAEIESALAACSCDEEKHDYILSL